MLALDLYESEICECGLHESVANDPTNFFTFADRVCPVCKATARYARVQHEQDEAYRKQLGDDPPASAPLLEDGRRTFLRPMDPMEVDLAKQRRAHGGS